MAKPNWNEKRDKGRLRIRMYCPGLGDCFLLSFFGGSLPRHLLIDCGVFNGAPGGKANIRKVAESIATETKGKLDAVVATHEHWDHVSGFYHAKDVFQEMNFGEIWMAWTEDRSHPVAKELKREKRLQLQAIHMALAQMANADTPKLRDYGQAVSELLGFYGGPVEGSTLAAFSERTAEAMEAVAQGKPSPTYFKPGNLIERSWLPDIRIYVLGPSMDPAVWKRTDGKVGSDTYGLSGANGSFFLALEDALALDNAPADPTRSEPVAGALPFHPSLQWRKEDEITDDENFKALYQEYMKEDLNWRRIDHDWLLSVARLGLQVDNATNNTSLVLAIEFVKTGKVLLFPADAQIASWKSWLNLKWELKEGEAEEKTVTTADLLRRTVFYKVGHHGSHNATMKENGLELMTDKSLVAAIPVDQQFANNSRHWEMPAKALLSRLQERSLGRILRADSSWPTPYDQPPEALSKQEWEQFVKSVNLDPDGLFIDYYIE